MRFLPIPTVLLACCLSACAAPSPPPRRPIPPSLTVPCLFLPGELRTWGDLARDYASALDALADCRARHRALVSATED